METLNQPTHFSNSFISFLLFIFPVAWQVEVEAEDGGWAGGKERKRVIVDEIESKPCPAWETCRHLDQYHGLVSSMGPSCRPGGVGFLAED